MDAEHDEDGGVVGADGVVGVGAGGDELTGDVVGTGAAVSGTDAGVVGTAAEGSTPTYR